MEYSENGFPFTDLTFSVTLPASQGVYKIKAAGDLMNTNASDRLSEASGWPKK